MDDGRREPPKADSGSGRGLIWTAVLLVVGASVVIALLVHRPDRAAPARAEPRAPRQDPVSVEQPPEPATIATVSPRAPSSAPVRAAPAPKELLPIDLFTPDVEESLRKTHEVTVGGGLLPVERMKELYQLGKDHPGDARPHLVMAEDAVNRGWDDFAVSHYVRAQKEDPRARQDPRMLKDLVALASAKRNSGKAADALASIYGSAAVPAVEEAIAAAADKGDPAVLERLEALSRRLASGAP